MIGTERCAPWGVEGLRDDLENAHAGVVVLYAPVTHQRRTARRQCRPEPRREEVFELVGAPMASGLARIGRGRGGVATDLDGPQTGGARRRRLKGLAGEEVPQVDRKYRRAQARTSEHARGVPGRNLARESHRAAHSPPAPKPCNSDSFDPEPWQHVCNGRADDRQLVQVFMTVEMGHPDTGIAQHSYLRGDFRLELGPR